MYPEFFDGIFFRLFIIFCTGFCGNEFCLLVRGLFCNSECICTVLFHCISFVSFVGLDEICFAVEKTIIEFLRSDKVSHEFLKQVFHPHLNNLTMEHVAMYKSIKDLKSNDGLKSPVPVITNSNNWVVSGKCLPTYNNRSLKQSLSQVLNLHA